MKTVTTEETRFYIKLYRRSNYVLAKKNHTYTIVDSPLDATIFETYDQAAIEICDLKSSHIQLLHDFEIKQFTIEY